MKSNKIYISKFIKRILESYIIEADEEKKDDKPAPDAEKEENPFASEGGDEGGEGDSGKEGGKEEDEKAAKPASSAPNGIPVKFNISAVKQYNNSKFLSNSGVVKSIGKDGLVVTTEPDGVDVFVNFDDISEHVNKFFKKTKKK